MTTMANADDGKLLEGELAKLRVYVLQLEEAVADYAHRFGLTDKARIALTPSSRLQRHKPDLGSDASGPLDHE